MTRRVRTLLGTLAILVLLIGYPLLVAALLGEWLATLPGWASIVALAVLGLLWFVPAAVVIRWMSAPDKQA